MLLPILVALLVINAFTISASGRTRPGRLPARAASPRPACFGLALIGGTPGAFLARRIFRHKTRKQPFSTWLILIALAQTSATIGIAIAR